LTVRIVRCRPAEARAQRAWIVDMQPWRGLGYAAASLGRWLARSAERDAVWVARAPAAKPRAEKPRGRGRRLGRRPGPGPGPTVQGIVVVQTPFLLGSFIALVAVRPEAAGRGIGRALMDRVQRQVFLSAGRRWLYVSADSRNRAALRFYRKLGFTAVGRLPDLIRPARTEILLRKGG
jgi:ribosomal protein S18 acetylase RimI-like enzyme